MAIPSFNGLDVQVKGKSGIIIIERNFDEGENRDQWSQFIVSTLTAQSVEMLEVDLGKCPIISSTVIAGLVHLYDFTNKTSGTKVTLRHCTKHVKSILDMMKLSDFFTYEDMIDKN